MVGCWVDLWVGQKADWKVALLVGPKAEKMVVM